MAVLFKKLFAETNISKNFFKVDWGQRNCTQVGDKAGAVDRIESGFYKNQLIVRKLCEVGNFNLELNAENVSCLILYPKYRIFGRIRWPVGSFNRTRKNFVRSNYKLFKILETIFWLFPCGWTIYRTPGEDELKRPNLYRRDCWVNQFKWN